MKTLISVLLLFVLTHSSFSQDNQSDTTKMNEIKTEVLEVVRAWNKAFAANDPKTYFGYIHEDVTLFLPSSPYRIDGKKDDMAEFKWSLSTGQTRVSLFQELQPKVQVLSETSAVVTYHIRAVFGPEGEEQFAYLKETDVLVKENGQWKIIHIHVSK